MKPTYFFILSFSLVFYSMSFAKGKLVVSALNSPVKESHFIVKLEGVEKIAEVTFKPKNGGEEKQGELVKEGSHYNGKFKTSELAPGNYDYRVKIITTSGKAQLKEATSVAFIKFVIDPSLEVADPGEAGKKTLPGIDSDNDGVRDDVQRWINETYPKSTSENIHKALRQTAKGLQASILNSEDKVKAVKSLDEFQAGVFCLLGQTDIDRYELLTDQLKEITLNTVSRTRSYLQSNHFVHGTTVKIPNSKMDELSNCTN